MLSSSKSQYTRQGAGPVPSSSSSSSCPLTPRSILKCTTPQPAARPPHPCVRFPSSPKLSTVHITHCPSSYDRTPITIGPNSCAMPERGTRSYSPGGTATASALPQNFQWSNHVHPSALARQQQQYYAANCTHGGDTAYDTGLLPPPLSSDDGSSEDSDGIASPPPESDSNHPGLDPSYMGRYAPSQSHRYSDPLSHPPIPQSSSAAQCQTATSATDYSLSFLPHAPSKKRDKSRRSSPPAVAFSSSWCQSDESSCLGGF